MRPWRKAPGAAFVEFRNRVVTARLKSHAGASMYSAVEYVRIMCTRPGQVQPIAGYLAGLGTVARQIISPGKGWSSVITSGFCGSSRCSSSIVSVTIWFMGWATVVSW